MTLSIIPSALVSLFMLFVSLFVHELGHAKFAHLYGSTASIRWGWKDWETTYDVTGLTKKQQEWILIAGILLGCIPLAFLMVLSYVLHPFPPLAAFILYLYACLHDIRMLRELEMEP